MKNILAGKTISTGLAIFSMFFGAGNLMYPIAVGLVSGDATLWGMAGFIVTTVILPTLGLVSMILFDGDYEVFFGRLGKVPGFLVTLLCMLVIGPMIAMPRIVTLSHIMIAPFIPAIPSIVFSIIFLGLTFLTTYKESKIMDLLGNIISPILLTSLSIIIAKGFFGGNEFTITGQDPFKMFWTNLEYGYNTLDVLGGIFFASIVLSILHRTIAFQGTKEERARKYASLSLQAGAIGTSLLAIIYVGLGYLGAYFGHGLEDLNEGALFSTISHRVIGTNGAFIIATAVLMACFSTIIALAAVFAEYLQKTLFRNRITYVQALIIALIATMIPAYHDLGTILLYSKKLTVLFYPAIIVLILINLAYKLFGFKPVKIPVAITLLISIYFQYFAQ